jgi:hypothetical protein
MIKHFQYNFLLLNVTFQTAFENTIVKTSLFGKTDCMGGMMYLQSDLVVLTL